MTALLFDGFDHADKIDRWTNASSFGLVTTPVRTGTRSVQVSGINLDDSNYLDLGPSQLDDVIYVGFGFYAANQFAQPTLTLFDRVTPTLHLSLRCNSPSRQWQMYRGGDGAHFGGTKIAETDPNVFQIGSWHYIEVGAKIDNAAGWMELRQDGITRLRFDGDTQNGGSAQIDRVGFATRVNGMAYFIDDVYILNEQGTVNNSWLGDTRCYPLYPNGNGTSSTPLSGSDGNSTDNYLLVDEVGPPDITDYVFSQTDGDQDTYTFEDLPVTLGTIRGVEVRIHAAKDETGTKQVRAITRRSGTDSFGPDHTLAAIPLYQTHHDIDELDPHAGPGTWTISNINSTEWGVEVRP